MLQSKIIPLFAFSPSAWRRHRWCESGEKRGRKNLRETHPRRRSSFVMLLPISIESASRRAPMRQQQNRFITRERERKSSFLKKGIHTSHGVERFSVGVEMLWNGRIHESWWKWWENLEWCSLSAKNRHTNLFSIIRSYFIEKLVENVIIWKTLATA